MLDALDRVDIRTRRPDEWLAVEAGLLVEQTRSAGLSLADRFCLVLGAWRRSPEPSVSRSA